MAFKTTADNYLDHLYSRFDLIMPGNPPDEGCWNWNGYIDNHGYGVFQIRIEGKKRLFKAHKVSYEKFNGKAVPSGLVVRHICDRPSCIQPSHLLIGTVADNNKDMVERGRQFSKLTSDDVREIRIRLANKESQTKIATIYGVNPRTISAIKLNKIWSHVD